ncbi:hypothetical protein OGATHE_000708 [Ogataea polymorpha]|uniref:Uncharacterized protein n=1 Tax=Ogataea polymorpha TaxID=460523 RepID=A0A9P8PTH4_9ASCO|nr:hypothetical protein OGATHE_000708 [Ogataea polymorpha]
MAGPLPNLLASKSAVSVCEYDEYRATDATDESESMISSLTLLLVLSTWCSVESPWSKHHLSEPISQLVFTVRYSFRARMSLTTGALDWASSAASSVPSTSSPSLALISHAASLSLREDPANSPKLSSIRLISLFLCSSSYRNFPKANSGDGFSTVLFSTERLGTAWRNNLT